MVLRNPNCAFRGTSLIIRFKIFDCPTCGVCTASAYVMSRPSGAIEVPEEYGGAVTIIDRTGCFLNEPTDQLVGRVGYATYLTTDPEFQPGPCPGLPETGWEIISMCCIEDACS